MMRVLLSVIIFLALVGCSDQSKKEVKEVTKKVENIDVQKVVQKSKEKASEVGDAIKDVKVEKVVEETSKKVEEISKEVVKKAEVINAKVAKKTEEITKDVAKTVNEALDSVQKTSSMPQIPTIPSMQKDSGDKNLVNGEKLFSSKCATCHGVNAEKKALNTSKVIAGWDENKIVSALKGYKDGSYGGAMKAIMKGQVSTLSDEEIQALAKTISEK
jgi:cytochrome c553